MLRKKLLRDIAQHKAQFLCIFFMTFIGIGVYVGINSAWYGMQESANQYYEQQNLADVWVSGYDFSDEKVEAILELPFVEQVQRRLIVDATVANDKILRLNYIDNDRLSKLKIIEGQVFETSGEGIYVEARYANNHDIAVGDQITFEVDGVEDTQTVKALINSPEYVYYQKDNISFGNKDDNFGYAFLSKDAFFLPNIPYTSLALTLNQTYQSSYGEDIKEILQIDKVFIQQRDDVASYKVYNDEIEQIKQMSFIFPVIFLAIAILSTMSAMVRIVSKQRGQIGILKALGYRNKKIVLHYLSYVLWITLAGVIAGYAVGPTLLGNFILFAATSDYTIPGLRAISSSRDVWVIIGSIVLIVGITYMACRKELHEIIAESLKVKSPTIKKRSFIERTALWNRLGFYIQWNVRDIFRNKVRTLMGIFGVAGTCMLLICALGLNDSIKSMSVRAYEEMNTANTRINMNANANPETVLQLQKEYEGHLIMETAVQFSYDGIEKQGVLNVIEDQALQVYETINGDIINVKDGAAISYKMAKNLNVAIGDTIKWRNYGDEDWETITIKNIYRAPLSQGIVMSSATYETLYGRTFTPTAILTLDKKENIKENDAIYSVQKISELKNTMDENLKSMDSVIAVMVLGSIFLCVVVMYNLGVLTLNEKTRELASLRVLGFRNKKVAKIFKKQNMWITIIGILVGTPIGLFLLDTIIVTMPEDIDMMQVVHLPSYIAVYVGIIALTIVMNFLFTLKIKKVDMVESLKGIE